MVDSHVAVAAYALEQKTRDVWERVGIHQRRIHHKTLAGIIAVGSQFLGLVVEEMIAEGVEPAAQIAEPVLMAFGVFGKDQIISFGDLVDELEALVGRGLTIVVQADDDIALHMVEARHQRAVLTKVAAQIHKHNGGIFFAQPADYLRHVVRTAVVDQHDFVIILISARRNRFS